MHFFALWCKALCHYIMTMPPGGAMGAGSSLEYRQPALVVSIMEAMEAACCKAEGLPWQGQRYRRPLYLHNSGSCIIAMQPGFFSFSTRWHLRAGIVGHWRTGSSRVSYRSPHRLFHRRRFDFVNGQFIKQGNAAACDDPFFHRRAGSGKRVFNAKFLFFYSTSYSPTLITATPPANLAKRSLQFFPGRNGSGSSIDVDLRKRGSNLFLSRRRRCGGRFLLT